MGYFKDTLRGVSWMGGLRVSTRLLAFVKIAILARILTPSQFGLFGIALLVLAFLETMTESGINIFLIQEKAKLEKYNDTAWLVSIFRGLLISLIIFLSANAISSFFKSGEARNLILLISLIPLVRGFINPAIVKFQKELRFNYEFLIRLSIYSLDALVAVFLALITRSAVSLVWGMLAGVILEVIISHVFIKPKPRFNFEIEKIKKVFHRGKWITLAGIFQYLFKQGDDIVVGRLLNASALGLYQVAYKISTLPITEVADTVIKVTFPVYVKISDDKKRLRKAFFKTALAVFAVTFPFGLIIFMFSKEVILILLGPNWLGAVGVLKVLAAFGVIRALSITANPLFLSLKKQNYLTVVTFVGIVGLAATIFPLIASYGIIGAALSALIGAIVAMPVYLYYTFRILT